MPKIPKQTGPNEDTLKGEPTCENCHHSYDWHREPGSKARAYLVVCVINPDKPMAQELPRNMFRNVTGKKPCQNHKHESYDDIVRRIDWQLLLSGINTPVDQTTESMQKANWISMRLATLFRAKGYGRYVPGSVPDVGFLLREGEY